jgi:diaminopimelate decarboxylase
MWQLSSDLATAISNTADKLQSDESSFYLHELAVARRYLRRLRQAMPPRVQIYYAMKANPHRHALGFLSSQPELAGVEVASAGELRGALEFITGDRVAFSGPGKTQSELRDAIRAGVGFVHVESLTEAHRLAAAAAEQGVRQDVLVRVNPGRGAGSLFNACGHATSKFGIDVQDLDRVLEVLRGLPALRVAGVHVHSGSGFLDAGEYLAHADHAMRVALLLRERGFAVERIGLGGGLGLDYQDKGHDLHVERIGEGLDALARSHGLDASLAIEPGRYLIGAAGVYVTPIVDIKVSGGRKVIVTAGGINHQRRPSTYGGNHPVAIVGRAVAPLYDGQPAVEREVVAEIGGPLCTERDWLARDVHVERAAIGDLVVIGLSGAYGASASAERFLAHPAATEVYLCDGAPYRGAARVEAVPARGSGPVPAPAMNELEAFLAERVAPIADRLDSDVTLMSEIVREMAKRGLTDFQLAAKVDPVKPPGFLGAYCTQVAAHSAALAFTLKQIGAAYRTLERYGSGRGEIEILLGNLRRGVRTAGIGFSSGHAPHGVEPIRGVRQGQEIILNGPLGWVTGHGIFDLFVVDFILDGQAYIAPVPFVSARSGMGGLTFSQPMPLVALSGTGTVSARFDGWRVPAELVLGPYDAVAEAQAPGSLLSNCHLMLGSCDGLARLLAGLPDGSRSGQVNLGLIECLDEWSREADRLRSELKSAAAGGRGFEWALHKKIEVGDFAQRFVTFASGVFGARTALAGHAIRRYQAELAVLSLASNHPNARPMFLDFHRPCVRDRVR